MVTNFKEKYPRLFNLFGAYFPDADFDNLTDEEVVANYRLGCRPEDLSATQLELNSLIDNPSYWQDAIDDANRYFSGQKDIFEWFSMIRSELSK